MVEKIKTYLESEDQEYNQGLILLSSVSKNRILLANLSRKQYPERLRHELKKMLDHFNRISEYSAAIKSKEIPAVDILKNEIPDIEQVTRVRIIRGNRTLKYEDLPKEYQNIWDENTKIYHESRSIHEKLKLMEEADPASRKPLIDQLLSNTDIIRSNWNKVDEYTNPSPAQSDKAPTDTIIPKAINYKRISANRTYISRCIPIFESDKTDLYLKAKIQIRITELLEAKESFKDSIKQNLIDLGFEMELKS